MASHLIIEEVDENTWVERERYWIAFYRAAGHRLFNKALGGEGSWGFTHSKEAKIKIKLAANMPAARERMRRLHLGKQHSDETKDKMRTAHKGKPKTSEAVAAAVASRAAGAGWHVSAESRLKMSLSRKGKSIPEHVRAKMRIAHRRPEAIALQRRLNLGKKLSPETKAKLSAAAKRRKDRGPYHSDEAIEKMRQARLKNPIRAWLGKKLPDAMRANMRRAWKLRKQKRG